jgi:hypothetical protein
MNGVVIGLTLVMKVSFCWLLKSVREVGKGAMKLYEVLKKWTYMMMEFWLSSSCCWDYRRSSSALDLQLLEATSIDSIDFLKCSSSPTAAPGNLRLLSTISSCSSTLLDIKRPVERNPHWVGHSVRQVDAHCSSEVRTSSSRKRACSNCAARPFFGKHWVISELVIPANYRKLTD